MTFIPEAFVETTLSFLNNDKIPYGQVKVNTKADTFVTYTLFDERDIKSFDNKPDLTVFSVQINVVDQTKMNVLIDRKILSAMRKAGFEVFNSASLYNPEAQNYQKSRIYRYQYDTETSEF